MKIEKLLNYLVIVKANNEKNFFKIVELNLKIKVSKHNKKEFSYIVISNLRYNLEI
jgi:hypothetical protein